MTDTENPRSGKATLKDGRRIILLTIKGSANGGSRWSYAWWSESRGLDGDADGSDGGFDTRDEAEKAALADAESRS